MKPDVSFFNHQQQLKRDSEHGKKLTDGIDLGTAFIVLPICYRVAGDTHEFGQFKNICNLPKRVLLCMNYHHST